MPSTVAIASVSTAMAEVPALAVGVGAGGSVRTGAGDKETGEADAGDADGDEAGGWADGDSGRLPQALNKRVTASVTFRMTFDTSRRTAAVSTAGLRPHCGGYVRSAGANESWELRHLRAARNT